ncbi:hypothetical protein [aff. Roholtiella sp. LEGE 12411]|uniref:hypothetical protein n=1 Tax=aff. Roholtiella sp. LEGE 12411 TaxID=1828822 RepID=UPI001881E588|nr:hypothetical protein [aff. Roholtiella sp. LEGE 12411]MBE9037010.1 hypothetical protein [aff. Roholtiella sp. LEGE 12411]
MDVKLLKKSDKLTLRQLKEIEEAEDQLLQSQNVNFSKPVVEELPVITSEPTEPDYIPSIDSVGKSGWQVSDIWKDIRLDNF